MAVSAVAEGAARLAWQSMAWLYAWRKSEAWFVTYRPPATPPAISDFPMDVHDNDFAVDFAPEGWLGFSTVAGLLIITT